MRELKFSLLLLHKQKLLYYIICIFMLFSLIDVVIVFIKYIDVIDIKEKSFTAEYLFMLYFPYIRIAPYLIFGFPVLCSLPLADATWVELEQGSSTFLYHRLSYMKLAFLRYGISIALIFLLTFFCFFLNFASMSVIFGNGKAMTYVYEPAFQQHVDSQFFLDSLRNSNPTLFAMSIMLHMSIMYGLLAGFSYAFSFIFKNRYLIFVGILILIFGFEIITMLIRRPSLSIITQLQPMSVFSLQDAITMYFILLVLGISILASFLYKKKDMM